MSLSTRPDLHPYLVTFLPLTSARGILDRKGEISSRGPGTDGAARQRDALLEEEVDVTQSSAGAAFRVSLARYGWFPDSVEEEEDGDGDGEA